MTARKLFSKNIAYLRNQAGMSRPDMGAELGLKRQTIGNWELAKGTPDYDMLVILSNFFDIGIDNLLTVDLSALPVTD
jgi:transcriptional regulator with XRE-family HTH domain